MRMDFELSWNELIKRIAGWADITLVNRLESYGYQHYTPEFKKKIRDKKYTIPKLTREKLERKYANMVSTKPPPERKGKAKWMELLAWLKSLKLPELNIDFSQARLEARRLRWAYVKGDAVVLSNKKGSGKPHQKEAVPQYTIYRIEVITDDDIESWIQASQSVYFGPDPMGKEERAAAAGEVEMMQQRNEDMSKKSIPSKELYAWWNHGADDAKYIFIGIGVYVV